ncbi:hypothetical protein R1flu_000264 [Riccia fluitans]|uniref:Uncharacterized protein n=1 Tax=Riccia fluitans TaxID=41844 RepID=A0ABD1Y471_9MARC
MNDDATGSSYSDDPTMDSRSLEVYYLLEELEKPDEENEDDQDNNGDRELEVGTRYRRGLSLSKLLEHNDFAVEILAVPPGNDVVSDVSRLFKTSGALYVQKATGTVSFAVLESPNFRTVQTLSTGPYRIVNMYGPLPGEEDRDIQDALWAQLASEAGVFWGRVLRPLIAETQVDVWLVRGM